MRKEQRELVDIAARLGFKYVGLDGGGHIELKHENGTHVTLAATPSEYRGRANAIALLERIAGRKLPRVRQRRSRKAQKPSGFSIDVACREHASWHVDNDSTIDQLITEREELIELCRQHAQRRGMLRAIPPLLDHVNAIEKRLRLMGQPVETFDPFTLSTSE